MLVTIKAKDVYPITTREEPSGKKYSYITEEDLRLYTPPVKLPNLLRYLNGSTMYLWGFDIYDVEGWLNKWEKVD